MELRDGRWLLPLSTWMGWKGEAPNGMFALALVSHDQGPDVADLHPGVRPLGRGRHPLGAVAGRAAGRRAARGRLVLNWKTGAVEPTPFALATDGEQFTVRGLAGWRGQTSKLTVLPDGRIFAAYRRQDQPGLWGTVSRLEGDQLINLDTGPLWQGAESGMTGGADTGSELIALKFGYPQAVVEPDGSLLLAFWCEEDCIVNIRWLRIRV